MSDENFIDIRKLFAKLLHKWYYFAIGLMLCVGLAVYYIKTSEKVYEVRATLQLKDQNLTDKGTSTQKFISGLELLEEHAAIEDEIGILSSYSMVKQAISDLNFTVSYYSFGLDWGFLSRHMGKEVYQGDFNVLLAPNVPQIIGVPIYITFTDRTHYRIEVDDEEVQLFDVTQQVNMGEVEKVEINDTLSLQEPFQHEFLSFRLNLPAGFVPDKNTGYYFIINSLEGLAESYLEKLEIAPISDNSNIVSMATKGAVIKKEEDFLNTLAEVYIQNDLNKKNQLGIRTIDFIDQQLANVSDSLSNVENKLESFRVDNQIVDIDLTARSLTERLDELEEEQAQLSVQNEYFKNMASYLYKSEDLTDVVAPSALGINDPLLNSLIVELSELNREKTGLDYSSNKNNPVLKVLERKIQNTKASLIDNINNLISSSNTALEQKARRIYVIKSKLKRLPENERDLVNIRRRYTLSDNIYNYLLQKRAEAGIAIASNVPDKRIVDLAKMKGTGPVAPKSMFILILAALAGFGFPLGLILVQDFFNTKILEKKDLKDITSIPLLGVIASGAAGEKLVVKDEPASPTAESFRFLRINLQHFYHQYENKVIGITSSIEGEGKTFCAVNLSVAFARAKHRTLLIGADLRQPKIQEYFDIKNEGIAEYLSGKAGLEEVIQTTPVEHLDILAAGNASAEVMDNMLEEYKIGGLISKVRDQYHTVIVDTPPTGYVADFFNLAKYFDINLLVVRYNHTDRSMLEAMEEKMRNNKIGNLNLLFNGVKSHASREYGFYKSKKGYYSQRSNSIEKN